ncbi:MAG: hypothetical protein IJ112_06000 [Oscillospiraceae bacterium]|nr:hypothetical protein [Oscillospiraceae bacterium]
MKKIFLAIPVCAAAAGAAFFVLKGKSGGDASKAAAPAKSGAKAAPAKKAAKPANEKTCGYNFACGYNDPAKVEATFRYDADKFSVDVVEDGFLVTTSVPSVVLLTGDDFQFQMEYGDYYGGEDFAAFSKGASERYKGFGTVQYGGVSGIKYREGESICLAFPAGDAEGYVLFQLFNGKGNDDPVEKLPERDDVSQIMGSLTCKVTR